ncbi:(d)CMP kinase [Ureaplasma canigenitalium]|uniref:(d)CMP kinase n=1 Tax=Ureaplasma canigenitalium TaxID=42092 RepID=UPI0004E11ECF|nr:(d)CMP kinase [Ureaplasma canigenitalium]
MNKKVNYSIAIDGPSGSGKSSVAKWLANKLHLTYINTGLVYRTIAYLINKANLPLTINDSHFTVLDQYQLNFNGDKVVVDGEEISSLLASQKVANQASTLSMNQRIRDYANNIIKKLASQVDVIMDGRDIGTVVLPDAFLKIYLTSTLKERATRRFLQNQSLGMKDKTYEEIFDELLYRDTQDMTRAIAPLKKATDAYEIMNDGMNIEETALYILGIYNDKLKNKEKR